jgi:Cu/Ag efflux protein CusF
MAGRVSCLAFVLGAMLTVLASAPRSQAQAQQPEPPAAGSIIQPTGKKPFVFRGIVEKVNAAGGTVDVKNDNIPGWMAPMSMTYRLDTLAVLKTLKGGDRITATVYEGDTARLYRVRVVTLPATQTQIALPPVSYVCPSPGEESFIDDKPGKCPKSGAELQAVRLDVAYKCLKTSYIREKPGTCPIDRTDLVPVTASIFWLCKSDPDPEKHYLEPGTCRDGSPRETGFEVRPHGDHNPRHGGPAVFMSEDLYHHVEATLVAPTRTQPALFRVYLYDEYTRPIHAAGLSAHVVATDRNGKPAGSSVPLVLSRIRDGNAMEARLPNAPVPSESAAVFLALRVKLKPSDRDWLTDHTFTSYSKEPVSRAPTKQGLLAELQKNMDSVTKQWQEGSLDGLWYPALRVKDVVLKLQQDHGHDIPEDKQAELASAVQRTTQSAWQIDSAGDLGNKEKIAVLYEVFHTAVGDILGLYGAGH